MSDETRPPDESNILRPKAPPPKDNSPLYRRIFFGVGIVSVVAFVLFLPDRAIEIKDFVTEEIKQFTSSPKSPVHDPSADDFGESSADKGRIRLADSQRGQCLTFIESQADNLTKIDSENALRMAECFLLYDQPLNAIRMAKRVKDPPGKVNSKLRWEGFLVRIRALLRAGKSDRAFKLANAECKGWRPGPGCVAKVMVLTHRRNLRAADKGFRALKSASAKLFPYSFGELWFSAGSMALHTGNFGLARERFDAALRHSRTRTGYLERVVLESLAITGLLSNRTAVVEDAYRKSKTVLAEEDPTLRRRVSLYLSFAKNPAAGSDKLRKYLKSPNFYAKDRGHLGAIWALGILAVEHGAVKEYESFVSSSLKEMAGALQSSVLDVSFVEQWLLRSQFAAGETNRSLSGLETYRKRRQEDVFYHHLKGSILVQAGERKKLMATAAGQFARAVNVNKSRESMFGYTLSLIRVGKLTQARSKLKQLRRGVKGSMAFWVNVLTIELELASGKIDAAKKHLQHLERKRKTKVSALVDLRKRLARLTGNHQQLAKLENQVEFPGARWANSIDSRSPVGPLSLLFSAK